jgi:hypothetical protein
MVGIVNLHSLRPASGLGRDRSCLDLDGALRRYSWAAVSKTRGSRSSNRRRSATIMGVEGRNVAHRRSLRDFDRIGATSSLARLYIHICVTKSPVREIVTKSAEIDRYGSSFCAWSQHAEIFIKTRAPKSVAW